MNGAETFFVITMTIQIAATAFASVFIFRALRSMRQSSRDRKRVVSASVESFEVTDGWVLANIRFSTGKFETWAVGQGGEQWKRLPGMCEASPSWGRWLTHELGADNQRRALERVRSHA